MAETQTTQTEARREEVELINFDDIKRDLIRLQRRTKDAKYLEAKQALADDVYPLMSYTVDQIDARFAQLEQVVAELAANETDGSAIDPILADQILGVFQLGLGLCEGIERSFPNGLPEPLALMVKTYREAEAGTRREVQSVITEDDDEDDEGEDDDDEDDRKAPGDEE